MNRNTEVCSIEQFDELLDREAARANQTAQSSSGDLFVIRARKAKRYAPA